MAIFEFRGQFPDLDAKDRQTQIQKRHGGEDVSEAYTFNIYANTNPSADDIFRFLMAVPRGELWSIRRFAIGIGTVCHDAFPLIRSPYYDIVDNTGVAQLLKTDLPIGPPRAWTDAVSLETIKYEAKDLYQTDLSEGDLIGFEAVSTLGDNVEYGFIDLRIVRTPTREALKAQLEEMKLHKLQWWERLWTGVLTKRRG